jgi:hypothetical protein
MARIRSASPVLGDDNQVGFAKNFGFRATGSRRPSRVSDLALAAGPECSYGAAKLSDS